MGCTPSPFASGRSLQSRDRNERKGITDITTTMEEDPNDLPPLNFREVQLPEPFASIHIVL